MHTNLTLGDFRTFLKKRFNPKRNAIVLPQKIVQCPESSAIFRKFFLVTPALFVQNKCEKMAHSGSVDGALVQFVVGAV